MASQGGSPSFSQRYAQIRVNDASRRANPSWQELQDAVHQFDFQFESTNSSQNDHAEEAGLEAFPLTDFGGDSSATQLNVRKRHLKSLIRPILLLTVPIALLAATLLGLVRVYKVQTRPSLFPGLALEQAESLSYILVDYPATRIVFVASIISSLAPFLSGFIMSLWALPVAHCLRANSQKSNTSLLPTPYQLNLVIGITLASYERLWTYMCYCFSKSRSKIPPVLRHAALVLFIATLASFGALLTDSGLHYTTQTINYNLVAYGSTRNYQPGRGLSQRCLSVNRIENDGMPCTYDALGTNTNRVEEDMERFYLQHNSSTHSRIQVTEMDASTGEQLALLVPLEENIPLNIDFRASTIGISAQCPFITPSCDMRLATTNFSSPDSLYTVFNCSSAFYGVLGKSPELIDISTSLQPGDVVATDPDVPPLAYKPSANLQYFFSPSSTLSSVYNTVGYDPETLQPSDSIPPLPDKALVNPIYMGVAARISGEGLQTGDDLNSSAIFNSKKGYYELAMSCRLTSYDVEYSRINGTFTNITTSASPNGSVIELAHGAELYITFSGPSPFYGDALLQADMEPTTEALAAKFGSLYAFYMMGTIGSVTTPREALALQTRTEKLVTRVSRVWFFALVSCCLTYTFLGAILGAVAYQLSFNENCDVAAQLSLPGLAWIAFPKNPRGAPVDPELARASIFEERYHRNEKQRVRVYYHPDLGCSLEVAEQ